MFIFRTEHDRTVCNSTEFRKGGISLTGHGPYKVGNCTLSVKRPNYGTNGMAPTAIMPHERCAVTANQFFAWITTDHSCKYTSSNCTGSTYYCDFCPDETNLKLPDGWSIVAYWVEDESDGIDWYQQYNQIMFNPAFAINMGTVQVSEIEEFVSEISWW